MLVCAVLSNGAVSSGRAFRGVWDRLVDWLSCETAWTARSCHRGCSNGSGVAIGFRGLPIHLQYQHADKREWVQMDHIADNGASCRMLAQQ